MFHLHGIGILVMVGVVVSKTQLTFMKILAYIPGAAGLRITQPLHNSQQVSNGIFMLVHRAFLPQPDCRATEMTFLRRPMRSRSFDKDASSGNSTHRRIDAVLVAR